MGGEVVDEDLAMEPFTWPKPYFSYGDDPFYRLAD